MRIITELFNGYVRGYKGVKRIQIECYEWQEKSYIRVIEKERPLMGTKVRLNYCPEPNATIRELCDIHGKVTLHEQVYLEWQEKDSTAAG